MQQAAGNAQMTSLLEAEAAVEVAAQAAACRQWDRWDCDCLHISQQISIAFVFRVRARTLLRAHNQPCGM